MADKGSFKLSELPPPVADLVKRILLTKSIYRDPNITGISSAPTADEVVLEGPGVDGILSAVAAVKAYNPPDDGPEPPDPPDPPDPPEPPVTGLKNFGLNLDEASDWGSAMIFSDRMRHARPWLEGGSWNAASGIPLDANGYPTSLPYNGKTVHTLLTRDLAGYPNGKHVCLYEGDGQIDFDQDARVTARSAGRIEFDVTSSGAGIHMSITRSTQGNNIRNVRVLMPNTKETDLFNPEFLDRMKRVGVLRFMDWNDTNGSNVVQWSDRGLPGYYTQNTGRGVAFEHQIALANRTGATPWLCVPHKANDDYVKALAKLVKEKLSDKLKVYVEYSNEVWNGGFPQQRWCAEQGFAKGFNKVGNYPGDNINDGGTRMWTAIKYQAYRSGTIFKIMRDALGSDRVIGVLAAQAGNAETNRVLFESFADSKINSTGGKADAMAIAPYFGNGISGSSVDDIISKCTSAVDSQTAQYTRQCKVYADRFKVPLVAYEGGQHLISGDGGQQNLQTQANQDPRMGVVYDKMFKAWTDNGGGLFVHFSFCWKPGPSGYWGAMESFYQSNPPKWGAIQRYLDKL